jgi:putative heme-binding domain-containing protein
MERAKERSDETGEDYTATDYLVESLAKPDAYLVEGYKNEMAIVYAPPISLTLDDIKAVISYLQSQGGDLDMEAIETPSGIAAKYYARIAAAGAAGGGDPGAGEEVFADNCGECHQLKGEGGEIGPPLDGISAKGLKFITDSILRPTKKITEGYETYRVVDNEGRRHVGLKTRDDGTEIDITKANGDVITIAKSDIKELEQDEAASIMPEDLTEAMTVKDFQDVQAFMMLQKPEEESQ